MERIKIDDFSNYTYLSGIKHSPDGKYACFATHKANLAENNYRSDLWLIDLATGRYRRLAALNAKKIFLWYDNETILFTHSDDQTSAADKPSSDTHFYKIRIHSGETEKAFSIPMDVSAIAMIDAARYLFQAEFCLNHTDDNCEIIDEIPFWSNGDGFTNKRRNRLYCYSVQAGTIEPITDEQTTVELFNLNPQKTAAVLIFSRFTAKLPVTNELAVYDITAKELRQISQPASLRHEYADYLANGSVVFTASDMRKFGLNENKKLFLFDGKTTTCISLEIDISIGNTLSSDCRYGGSATEQADGDHLYFVTTKEDRTSLNRVDRNGHWEELIAGNGSIDGISVSAGSILVIKMAADQLQELFMLTASGLVQLTTENNWLNETRHVAVPQKLTVQTEPGINIDGWILKPAKLAETKKHPAILAIHGGPKMAYGAAFLHDLQYLAAEGYIVFYCNPRGSDGKGDSFADIRGKYGRVDYHDIMKFTDAVLANCSLIDERRLGVIGGSYGGFLVNWLIGHTDRFKAAVSERSIANWISKFGTTDIGYYFVADQITATPWLEQDKLWQHSPLKYANRVKTPTLFLQAEEDYRCWLAEGLQMYTALKYHGVEARLCLFKNENHDLARTGKPKSRLQRLQEISKWFKQHLS